MCRAISYKSKFTNIGISGLHVIITWVYTAELALAWSQ